MNQVKQIEASLLSEETPKRYTRRRAIAILMVSLAIVAGIALIRGDSEKPSGFLSLAVTYHFPFPLSEGHYYTVKDALSKIAHRRLKFISP